MSSFALVGFLYCIEKYFYFISKYKYCILEDGYRLILS